MSESLNELKGNGGWLVLVGFGVVISPFRPLLEVDSISQFILTDPMWELLTSPETDFYRAYWAPGIIGYGVINLGLAIASSYLIYLYFAQKKLFPQLFIAILVFSLVCKSFVAWATIFGFPDQPMFDPVSVRNLGITLLIALIWIPYMRVSRRVRATFVK